MRPGTPPAPPPAVAGAALEARGAAKRFGGVHALDGFDLELEPGRVVALVGPNGSGKTTALRVLAGTVRADAGRVVLDGLDVTTEPPARRARRGLVRTLQSNGVFPQLTALENAVVGASLRGRHRGALRALLATPKARRDADAVRARALGALRAVGLEERRDERAETLTTAEQRLLMVASALAAEPTVLLLDEPSAGAGAADLDRLARILGDLRAAGSPCSSSSTTSASSARSPRRSSSSTPGAGSPPDPPTTWRGTRPSARPISDDALPTQARFVRLRTLAVLAFLLLLPACGGGGADSGEARTVTVVVNAPFSKTPYVGDSIARGAELGAARRRLLDTPDGPVRIRIERLDNALSPRKAIANVRARSTTARSRSSTRGPASTPPGSSPGTPTSPWASPTRAGWASWTSRSGRTCSASRRLTAASPSVSPSTSSRRACAWRS